MKITKNSLVLTAAFTGLLGGTMARVNAAPASGSSLSLVVQAAESSDKKDIEKHACRGLNSCKGNGGGSKEGVGQELLSRAKAPAPPTAPSPRQRSKNPSGACRCRAPPPFSKAYASQSI
jgi:hypothetical protein